jgi:ribulose-bisphosphate carboxylase large chain
MRYIDYVNLGYKPKKTELICKFYIEPLHLSLKETTGGVAAESSIGTWQEVKTEKPYMKKLAAKVFEIKKTGSGAIVDIAYPPELFEPGNMPNILSSVAGNIFGLEEIRNIRLLDIHFPVALMRSFLGPKYGIEGIRKIMKIKNRPLLGTIIKPKLGLNTADHARVAFEAWLGGCDIVKDDENLASQKFNKFEARLKKTLRMKEKAENKTGLKKGYLVNITAETKEMLRRVRLVQDYGNEYVMIDIITAGFAALQTLRQENLDLIIHGHRAGHAALTKSVKHGIKMKVIAKLCRLVGIDQLHVGAAFGKMFENKKEVKENINVIKENISGKDIKPVMPVASGGLNPCDIPQLIRFFGNDVVIQAGGGIHAHPYGTFSGAKAMKQALEASLEGISLKEYAKKHEELRLAIEKWCKG